MAKRVNAATNEATMARGKGGERVRQSKVVEMFTFARNAIDTMWSQEEIEQKEENKRERGRK